MPFGGVKEIAILMCLALVVQSSPYPSEDYVSTNRFDSLQDERVMSESLINKLLNIVQVEEDTEDPYKEDDEIATEEAFQNKIKKPLQFTCPSQQAVTGISSVYWYPEHDRLFEISCSKLPGVSKAKKTCVEIGTEYIKPILAVCPPNHFLTGIYSHHYSDVNYNDRRWTFTCCQYDKIKTQGCEMTKFINEYRGVIDYQAKYAQCTGNDKQSNKQVYLNGLYGIFDKEETDRRWRVSQCEAVYSKY